MPEICSVKNVKYKLRNHKNVEKKSNKFCINFIFFRKLTALTIDHIT